MTIEICKAPSVKYYILLYCIYSIVTQFTNALAYLLTYLLIYRKIITSSLISPCRF